MKILNVVTSGYAEGGTENGLILTKPLFEKRGHIVKTFASDTHPDLKHFNDYSYKAPSETIFGKLLYTANPYAYLSLKKTLQEFQPDIVHVHSIGYASPIILFPLKQYPTVFTIHGPEAFIKDLLIWCFPRSYFKNGLYTPEDLTLLGKMRYYYQLLVETPLYQRGLRNVDRMVTLSTYMHDLVTHAGIRNLHVPNGTTLLAEHRLQKERVTHTIVYAGRLKIYKGVGYLLEALPAILKKFPKTTILLAGSGEERNSLETLVHQLGIHHQVAFLGQLTSAELEQLYIKASVVVVPSIWPEAFGKVGIEAMSIGRPVVATNVGGISDWLIHGKNGFLVPPQNSQALAHSIITLFSDTSLLLRMGKYARKKSQEFDLEKYVERMEKIFRELQDHR